VPCTVFLPYADQHRPPLNIETICTEIEMQLDPEWSPHVAFAIRDGRLGMMISSSKTGSQTAGLWAAVEPILSAGVFTEPSS
jgi:hypothetical protein